MSVLNPESNRTFYTDALTAPAGLRFDRAVALTYSLDLDTLLSAPLYLLLHADGRTQTKLVRNRLAILDGLRRTADRLAIFHQRGRIPAPRDTRLFHSLLEKSVFSARAPGGGIFHPKVWLLRFSPVGDESTQATGGGAPLIRLAVLSRNLTAGRSWDVSLAVEGRRGNAEVAENEDLVRLLRALPRLSPELTEDSDRTGWIASLADDVAHTSWELPDGINELRLRAIGLGDGNGSPGMDPLHRGGWLPPKSERLVVMSPFCTAGTLERLAETCDSAAASTLGSNRRGLHTAPVGDGDARAESRATLISRAEALAGIPSATLERFERSLVLGETVSGEEEDASLRRGAPAGLHAKLYFCEEGGRTRLFVGSANATHPALSGANVEVLAELAGSRKALGSVEEFLGKDGLGALLEDFDAGDVETPASDEVEAQRLIETARDQVADLGFRLSCLPADDFDDGPDVGDSRNTGGGRATGDDPGMGGNRRRWRLALRADDSAERTPAGGRAGTTLSSGLRVTAWPITLPRERALDCRPLLHDPEKEVVFGPMAMASLTRFIAFNVALEDENPAAPPKAFVLRVPASSFPEERDKTVVVEVVRQHGFLPYLLFLLGDTDGLAVPGEGGRSWSPETDGGGGGGFETLPLLERMTRAFCRDPSRLDAVRRLVEDLRESETARENGAEILPKAFLKLWNTFESALSVDKSSGGES